MTRLLDIGIWNSQLGRISVIQLLWLKYLINSKWIFLSRVLCLKIPHPASNGFCVGSIYYWNIHPYSLCFEYYIICFLGTQNISRWLLAKLGRKTMFSVYSRQSCMQNSQHIASQHLSSKINIKLYSLLCWHRQRPLSINTRKVVATLAMAIANSHISCIQPIQPFWAAIQFYAKRALGSRWHRFIIF